MDLMLKVKRSIAKTMCWKMRKFVIQKIGYQNGKQIINAIYLPTDEERQFIITVVDGQVIADEF